MAHFAPIAVLALSVACADTSAQPAPPAPPQVTVAAALDREITEWDEFTGRLEAVDSVEVRPRVSGYVAAVRFKEGAIVRKGDSLFQIDPRPFQAEVDRLRAELMRARATVQRAASELQRAERLRAENAMSQEEHDRRAAFAQESTAQVAAVEAALRAVELNLEFTRVTSPISGRVEPRAGDRRQPRVERSRRSDADDDRRVARSDSRALRRRRAHLPAIHGACRRTGRTVATSTCRFAWRSPTRRDSRAKGRLDFLDNRLNPVSGTIRGRAVFRNSDGVLTPGLFVRLRVAGGGSSQALLIQDRAVGTDLDKKFVFVVGAGQDHPVPRRARSGPWSTACASCAAACRPAISSWSTGCSGCGPASRSTP